jgi:hypothetical protein
MDVGKRAVRVSHWGDEETANDRLPFAFDAREYMIITPHKTSGFLPPVIPLQPVQFQTQQHPNPDIHTHMYRDKSIRP